MTLAGQSIFVTGAARGIGAEVARQLGARGARVALVDYDGAGAARLAAQIPGAIGIEADVADRRAVERAAARAVSAFGGIDVVVANAAIAAPGFIRTMDPVTYERILDVDLLGVWRTVRACLPHVIERRGHLLLVASLAAVFPGAGLSAYTAAKMGVVALGDALRLELRPHGVSVGVAYFAWVDTPLTRGARPGQLGGTMRTLLRGPLGRLLPVEGAGAAVVRGIERRRGIVAYPRWSLALLPLRPVLPPLIRLALRGRIAAYDRVAERAER